MRCALRRLESYFTSAAVREREARETVDHLRKVNCAPARAYRVGPRGGTTLRRSRRSRARDEGDIGRFRCGPRACQEEGMQIS